MDESEWQALVEVARAGNVAPLVAATQRLGTEIKVLHERAFAFTDFPPCVRDYLTEIYGTKQTRRGRPGLTEWEREITRGAYEINRLIAEITKHHAGSGELIGGRVYPIDEKPSDYALRVVGADLGLTADAVRDRIHPRKRKPPE
ncbi:hypothetical protein [Immundisolibacter cernigliae]|uniref:hypothetical protein n=1 Tax=Immundisolibacter cernigliae TaxID=1810504 RepID=UPI000AA745DA|nr:hypothetical protein [Immundisolibacter cernigliae]